ncbi:flagellar hook-associated protein FlgL [Sansalvadorimonas sp. 2012CJ34-2]|uniref:Flagellar hook-associated protein FlgL n=1 Tax=Parendozoicomonas callyspongiae TaxID=2942213 RepID=A0ABT0PFQ5_9GAMM|nr:flagellar hook-associated protein FlgL [Sansalvadorimonas sp. 2012CJ34-2]MCL6270096.1 flagellar hook-associated protein FlgL [Sansalvadorimonas sp. 2012CJ34-2]
MRVSTMQLHNSMSGNIQTASTGVSKTMMQLSSNKRILAPSDDVFAASQLMGLDDDLSQLEVWSSNIKSATTMLSNQETALKDINNNMNRARDLAISAKNGSKSQEDLEAIAKELEQVVETIADLTNTKSSSGEYIFGGTKGDTAPIKKAASGWDNNSSSSTRKIEISDSQSASLGVTSEQLFGSSAEFLEEMDTFIAALKNPSTDNAAAVDKVIKDIDKAQKSVNESITTIGAEVNTLKAAETTNADKQLANKSMQSSLEDLDFAEATTRLSVQQTMLTAAQKSYSSTIKLSLFNYV